MTEIKQSLFALLAAWAGACFLAAAFYAKREPPRFGLIRVFPESLEIRPSNSHETIQQFDLSITNTSDDRLPVYGVHGTCGCTRIAPLKKSWVEPGESFSIRGEINLPFRNLRTAAIDIAIGSERVSVPVHIQPRNMQQPFIAVHSPTLYLSARNAEEQISHEFTAKVIEPADSTSSMLKEVFVTVPNGVIEVIGEDDCRVLNKLQLERSVKIKMVADAPRSTGHQIRGQIGFVRTDGSQFDEKIGVIIELKPPLRSIPAVISVDQENAEYPLQKRVLLIADTPFKIDKLRTSSESISARVLSSNLSSTKQEELEVKIEKLAHTGFNRVDEVRIITDAFPELDFVIPIRTNKPAK